MDRYSYQYLRDIGMDKASIARIDNAYGNLVESERHESGLDMRIRRKLGNGNYLVIPFESEDDFNIEGIDHWA